MGTGGHDGDLLAVLGAGDEPHLEADAGEPQDVGGRAAGEVGRQRDLDVVRPEADRRRAGSPRRGSPSRSRWPARRRAGPGVPTCSMRPSLITTISSATSIASSWSWVTKTVVTGTSSCRRRSHSRSSLRTLASRAPNGSSSSSTLGWTASARASAMRCRWPPESCDGSRSANCDRCTSLSSSSTRSRDLGLRTSCGSPGRTRRSWRPSCA